MIMRPGLRKFALTAHIISSVGWLGVVVAFMALAIGSLISEDIQRIRAIYLAMEFIGWFVLVPLSFASFFTGLVQSLGTRWGLFRHYWTLTKLLINLFANIFLLVYMQSELGLLVEKTLKPTFSVADLGVLRSQALLHSGVAVIALIVATTLSVYKPWGMTKYGERQNKEQRKELRAVEAGDD